MDEKKWYLSKTLWGVIIMVLGQLLGLFKINLGLSGEAASALVDQIVNVITVVSQFVGAILAIFGRFKASTKLVSSTSKVEEVPK